MRVGLLGFSSAKRQDVEHKLEAAISTVIIEHTIPPAADQIVDCSALLIDVCQTPHTPERLHLLRSWVQAAPDTPVIALISDESCRDAVIRFGAYDYIVGHAEGNAVSHAVRRAVQQCDLDRLVRYQRNRRSFDTAIVTTTPVMMSAVERAAKFALSDATVLICGEPGTEIDLLARMIHDKSERRIHPFTAIDCSTSTSPALLFGEQGCNPGGRPRIRRGLLETSERGTIYWREIFAAPPQTQRQLLRVLRERTFEREGSQIQRATAARFICSTSSPNQGAGGRQESVIDLHRFFSVQLHVPPLRERPDDILPLAYARLARIGSDTHLPPLKLCAAARQALRAYSWPGNTDELTHCIASAVVSCSGAEIRVSDLPPEISLAGELRARGARATQ